MSLVQCLDVPLMGKVVDEGDDSDESGSFGDEESEGEDWDELERKAKRGGPTSLDRLEIRSLTIP